MLRNKLMTFIWPLLALVLSLAPSLAAQDGKRYAVLIGVNDYADSSILKLKTPRNDVSDLGAALNNAGWDKVFLMKDDLDWRNQDFPSRSNILKKINLLADLAQNEDTIFLFFSGHGMSDSSGQYFLPADAELSRLRDSGVALQSLVETLRAKGLERVVLGVDACRESLSQTKGLSVVGLGGGEANLPPDKRPALAIYATQAGWYSFEDAGGRNGVFTRFLLEGLAGAADGATEARSRDGQVSFAELASWLPPAIAAYALDRGLRQKAMATSISHRLDAVVASRSSLAPQQPSPVPKAGAPLQPGLPSDMPDPSSLSTGQRLRLAREYLQKAGDSAALGEIETTLAWMGGARRLDPDLESEMGPLNALEDSLVTRVQELLNDNKNEDALDLLVALRPRFPTSNRLAFMEGMAWREIGKPAKAIGPFEQALGLGYDAVAAMAALAGVYRHLNDAKKTEEWYKKAIAGQGDELWWACYDYGDWLASNKRHQEAIVQFSKSMQINPEYPATPAYRALSYLALGKKDLAAKDAASARKLIKPNSGYEWLLDELKANKL